MDRNTIEKNASVELKIEDMSGEGLGIGHAAGMAVFVKDTVAGDRVRAKLVKVKKHYAYGRVEEVLEQSPDRVPARCPVARACGGCQLQEMRYEAQLALKGKTVRDCLQRIGGFAPKELRLRPIRGMEEPWHYRNKAQFPVGKGRRAADAAEGAGGSAAVIAGFYAGRTHTIIDNHQCEIGIDINRSILEAVLRYMEECGVPAYDEGTGSGTIRHVMTRAGFATGQLMVVIVAAADRLPQEERLVSLLRSAVREETELPDKSAGPRELVSILLNVNREKTNVILGRRNRILYGAGAIEDRIADLTFRISPNAFYQVNPVQTRVLYETALSFAGLTGRETVWDLYCGIGTISLFLARKAAQVVGVEVVPEAIRNARENARHNHIDNCEFIVGRAEDILQQRTDLPAPDVIVADPPRKGLDRAVVDTMCASAPRRIVYVSCAPATLARDLRLFADGGYRIEQVQPVDMFPHTVHVETVCLLTHNG